MALFQHKVAVLEELVHRQPTPQKVDFIPFLFIYSLSIQSLVLVPWILFIETEPCFHTIG